MDHLDLNSRLEGITKSEAVKISFKSDTGGALCHSRKVVRSRYWCSVDSFWNCMWERSLKMIGIHTGSQKQCPACLTESHCLTHSLRQCK